MTIKTLNMQHWGKRVCIRSHSGPHFPVFELNTERYGVCLLIQPKCRKMRTRIALNTDIFHVVQLKTVSFMNCNKDLNIPVNLIPDISLWTKILGRRSESRIFKEQLYSKDCQFCLKGESVAFHTAWHCLFYSLNLYPT